MSEKQIAAYKLINRHALYASGVGLIPMPWVDVAGIAAVQVKMLRDMARHYDVPFKEQGVKIAVAALIGGLAPVHAATGGVTQLVRAIPTVGTALSFLTTSSLAFATTWAVGRVFIQHFEAGGTFLDFDPEKVRKYFQHEYEKARDTGAATAS